MGIMGVFFSTITNQEARTCTFTYDALNYLVRAANDTSIPATKKIKLTNIRRVSSCNHTNIQDQDLPLPSRMLWARREEKGTDLFNFSAGVPLHGALPAGLSSSPLPPQTDPRQLVISLSFWTERPQAPTGASEGAFDELFPRPLSR